MDKTKICVTKVEVKKSPCMKKQNLLVYDKKNPCVFPVPKTNTYTASPIASPAVKKIKVCTGAELKRMCPPKLCECPPRKQIGFFGYLLKILGFGFKGAFAGGLVYWTYNLGLWGPSNNTEKIYSNMCHVVSPLLYSKDEDEEAAKRRHDRECEERLKETCIKVNDKDCCTRAPSISENANKIKQTWNTGITLLFDCLAHGPEYLTKLFGGNTTTKKID